LDSNLEEKRFYPTYRNIRLPLPPNQKKKRMY
jgi:hypothetical protein